MTPIRRLGLVIAGLVAAIGSVPAAAGGATPGASEGLAQPILLSNSVETWIVGQSRWVTLTWTSQRTITDVWFDVRGGAANVAIAYPDQAERATLATDSTLAANEIDTMTFLVQPTELTPLEFELDVVVHWTDGPTNHAGQLHLTFTQRTTNGAPFLILTDRARVPSGGDGSRNWVELGFLGVAADLRDFMVSVEGPLPVYYPQDVFTSLHHDAVLLADERDVARFWLDPSAITPGVYQLEIVIDYRIGSEDATVRQARAPLTVQVG
jgi:hypothetical protein